MPVKKGNIPWNKGGGHGKVKIICKQCSKEFTRSYGKRMTLFCSAICQAKNRVGIKRPEVSERLKGNKITLGYRHTIESRAKISAAGRLRGNGKMASYPDQQRIRKSFEYQLWRKAVFERDDFTCQKYGIRGGLLHAHHINNFADFPELRLAIDNGITLSEKAHKEFHKKYGKNNNSREQILDFLK